MLRCYWAEKMRRALLTVAIVALLASAALAAPPFSWAEITDSSARLSFQVSSDWLTSSYEYSNWQFGHVTIPQNAYLVYFNVSYLSCVETITDSSGSTNQQTTAGFFMSVSSTMPCSPAYSNLPSGSNDAMPCNPYQAYIYDYTQKAYIFQDLTISGPENSGYQVVGFVVPMQRNVHSDAIGTSDPYAVSTDTTYVVGSGVSVDTTGELWLGLGFDSISYISSGSSTTSYAYTCQVDISANVYSCPVGKVPIATNAQIDSPTCIDFTNSTVVANTWQTTNFGATAAQSAVIKLDDIPETADHIIVNVTVPYNSSNYYYPRASGGSSFVSPDAYLNIYSELTTSAVDCGLTNSDNAVDDTNTLQTFSFVCFAPRWNHPYYLAFDMAPIGYDVAWSASYQVVTCASGFVGQGCRDSITPITVFGAGSVATIPFNTSWSGYQHFYIDVPANSWNETLVTFSMTTSSTDTSTYYLFLRKDAYSTISYSDDLQTTSPYGNSTFYFQNKRNSWDNIGYHVSGSSNSGSAVEGLIWTPFDRYATRGTSARWVLTVACPNAGNNYQSEGVNRACSGSINVVYSSSSVDLPGVPNPPSTVPLPPTAPPAGSPPSGSTTPGDSTPSNTPNPASPLGAPSTSTPSDGAPTITPSSASALRWSPLLLAILALCLF